MIRLAGHIDVPLDRLAEAREALDAHILLTLAEDGCIAFSVTPDPTVAGRFMVAEKFTDRAAFDAHQARGRNSAWGHLSQGWPRTYTIDETAE